MSFGDGVLVGMGFLLLSAAFFAGIVIAPLLDKWRERAREIAEEPAENARVKQAADLQKLLNTPSRRASKHLDPHLEELVSQGRTGEALVYVREQLKLAYEQNSDTLVILYKKYIQQLESINQDAGPDNP